MARYKLRPQLALIAGDQRYRQYIYRENRVIYSGNQRTDVNDIVGSDKTGTLAKRHLRQRAIAGSPRDH